MKILKCSFIDAHIQKKLRTEIKTAKTAS